MTLLLIAPVGVWLYYREHQGEWAKRRAERSEALLAYATLLGWTLRLDDAAGSGVAVAKLGPSRGPDAETVVAELSVQGQDGQGRVLWRGATMLAPELDRKVEQAVEVKLARESKGEVARWWVQVRLLERGEPVVQTWVHPAPASVEPFVYRLSPP